MTKSKKLQLFDRYFPAAMTGVLSNTDIVKTVCFTNRDERVQMRLVEAAASYAHSMIELRENYVNNISKQNEKNKL